MSKYRDLSSGDVFPAYWTDAIQEFTGTLVAGLRLSTPSASTVRVAASTGSDQVAVGVDGLFRYRSSNAEVTVSGASGTYNLYVAVAANAITGVTDSTDYNWYLYVGASAPSGSISGSGTIVASRKVGEVDWDSVTSTITGLRQMSGAGDVTLPLAPIATTASVTPLVVQGTTSQSANLISAGSSSSTSDRLTLSAAGKLSLPVTGSNGGLLIGGDAALYRSASNTLRASGNLIADSTITGNALVSSTSVSAVSVSASGAVSAGTSVSAASASITNGISAATVTTTGNVSVGGSASAVSLAASQNNKTALTLSGASAGITFGGDTNLYRSAADTLKTDDSLIVDGNAVIGASGSTVGFYGATPAARSTGWNAANVTTDKSFDTNNTTVDEVANVLGTLINTLKTTGLIA